MSAAFSMGPVVASLGVLGGESVGSPWVLSWIARFSYPAVFLLLIACGLGAPLSEDVIVLTGGTVVAHAHGSFAVMALTAYLGKVCGDALIFRFGRKVGPHALTQRHFKRLFTPGRVAWIEGHFERYGILTVFFVRFLPGLRAPTYLVAGASRFPARSFLLADAAAASVSAPLLTWLGYRYGLVVLAALHKAAHGLVLGVIALVVLLGLVRFLRVRARVRLEASKVPPEVLEDLPRHVPPPGPH